MSARLFRATPRSRRLAPWRERGAWLRVQCSIERRAKPAARFAEPVNGKGESGAYLVAHGVREDGSLRFHVLMLVLTQMSIGMFVVAEGLLLAGARSIAVVVSAALIGAAGLAVAVLHLGRPQVAYRAWLGWRTSWMSREVIAFGVFVGLAGAQMLALAGLGFTERTTFYLALSTATCASGALALACSAMI